MFTSRHDQVAAVIAIAMLQKTMEQPVLPSAVQQDHMFGTLTKQNTAAGLTLYVISRARMWLLICQFWAQLCQLL